MALPGNEQIRQFLVERESTPEQLRLEEARALARSNPMAVANIVKNWVNGEVA